MAETARLTRIENMPEERRSFIEGLLRQRPRPSGVKIAAAYNREFPTYLTGEPDLDASTVYSHLKLRMQETLDDIRERKAEFTAMCEVIGEQGIDAATQAATWEAIQSMKPGQLILLRSVETQRKELDLKSKEQDRKLKEFELKEKQWQARQKEATKAIEEASEQIANGKPVTVADIQRLRERVIGERPQAPAAH